MNSEKMDTYLTLEMYDPDDTELTELGLSEEEIEEYHQVRENVWTRS